VRLVAPILSFTADEVWDYLPVVEGREASVHLAQFPTPEEIFSDDPRPVIEEGDLLREVRDRILSALEDARKDKLIGKALEADVQFIVKDDVYALLKRREDGLRELMGVSDVSVVDGSTGAGYTQPPADHPFFRTRKITDYLSFAIYAASGQKCARCWNFMPEVSAYGIWQNVCTRCQSALREMGIEPPQPTEVAS
jgi:isoleucyl-tRNA synthetase